MPTFELFPPQADAIWRPARRRFNGRFAAACSLLAAWIERTRQRSALTSLEDHMLRDIGITRADAARESRKPFWNA
jgi:uncharacterized protein YjiS (DUF1127 family)